MSVYRRRKHELPEAGQVARFVHLHLDTVRMEKCHTLKEEHASYTVEGKVRPMIVLRACPRERGRSWFLVAPLTTKGLDEDGSIKPTCLAVGSCVDPEKESFVKKNEVTRLPDNMLEEGGDTMGFMRCDQIVFINVIKILQATAMGRITMSLPTNEPGQ